MGNRRAVIREADCTWRRAIRHLKDLPEEARRLIPSRRAFIAAAIAATAAPKAAEAFGFFGRMGGGVAAPASTRLATLTLVNDSATPVGANTCSPYFGWIFKEGDVATGTYPGFGASGPIEKFSWGCQVYWPDGSLLFAAFVVRPASGVAGNGTLALGVWNGGTAPTTSARTLTEVYNQQIIVQATGQGTNFGLNGTLGAWINGDANQKSAQVYLDGDAGKCWRFDIDMAATVGGAAEGQHVVHAYVLALTDSTGAFGGTRVNYRITKPWWDNNTPAKNWSGFSVTGASIGTAGTAQVWCQAVGAGGVGTSTINIPWPYKPVALTVQSVSPPVWNATQNYVTGAADNSAVVPGFITSPAGTSNPLLTTRLYFAYVNGNDGANTMRVVDSSNGGNVEVPGNLDNTATFWPVPVCLFFGSLFGANSKARWNFFQGLGSYASDPATDGTLRVQMDKTYWHGTGLIPPWMTGVIFTDSAWGGSHTFDSSTTGPFQQNRGDTGTQLAQGIGYVPADAGRDWYNQSAASELTIRTIGYCGAYDGYSFRTKASRQYPNLTNTAYTGLDAPSSGQQALQWGGGMTAAGFTGPPANNINFVYVQGNPTHMAGFEEWAYLRTGEPQYLELLIEHALGMSLIQVPAIRNPTAAAGYPADGFALVTVWPASAGALVRWLSWSMRNYCAAAKLAPTTMPDGSQLNQYIWDVAENSVAFMNLVTANKLGAYCSGIGAWMPYTPSDPNTGVAGYYQRSSWQIVFMAVGLCSLYKARGSTSALTWLKNEATYREHFRALYSDYHVASFYEYTAGGNLFGTSQKGPIQSDDEWGIVTQWSGNGGLAWTTTSPCFTSGGTLNPAVGWTPAVGDRWTPNTADGSDANFCPSAPYTAMNVNAAAFTWDLTPLNTTKDYPGGSKAVSVGYCIKPSAGNAGGYVYGCSVGGVTSAAPTWPQGPVATTVADGTVTWFCMGQPGTAVIPAANGSNRNAHEEGPFGLIANPPAPSTHETTDAINQNPENYVSQLRASQALMLACGVTLNSGAAATQLFTDSDTRMGGTDWTGDPTWAWQSSF